LYTGAIVITTVVMTGILYMAGIKPAEHAATQYRFDPPTVQEFHRHVEEEAEKVSTLYGAFRRSAFQTTAIITTTGYGTADFDLWPDFCRFALLFLMFWGGCAGSTGGGIKIIRVMVVFKVGWRELKKIVNPHLVAPLKIAGMSMDERQVMSISAFVMLFLVTFVVGVFLMTLFVPDLMTAVSSVVATLANIGPGLNGIGSVENYGWIPVPGKWILIILMLLGRLELYAILLALIPSFWKK
jgi:trk system potassium uptake protein TrkH